VHFREISALFVVVAGMFLAQFYVSSVIGREPKPNAIEMLREDHRKVKQLFDEFEHAEESQAKEQIVETTVRELQVARGAGRRDFLSRRRETNE